MYFWFHSYNKFNFKHQFCKWLQYMVECYVPLDWFNRSAQPSYFFLMRWINYFVSKCSSRWHLFSSFPSVVFVFIKWKDSNLLFNELFNFFLVSACSGPPYFIRSHPWALIRIQNSRIRCLWAPLLLSVHFLPVFNFGIFWNR